MNTIISEPATANKSDTTCVEFVPSLRKIFDIASIKNGYMVAIAVVMVIGQKYREP